MGCNPSHESTILVRYVGFLRRQWMNWVQAVGMGVLTYKKNGRAVARFVYLYCISYYTGRRHLMKYPSLFLFECLLSQVVTFCVRSKRMIGPLSCRETTTPADACSRSYSASPDMNQEYPLIPQRYCCCYCCVYHPTMCSMSFNVDHS